MPDAVELFVVALHAGRSPAQAVVELARIAPAPVRPAFAAVEHRLHRGDGVGDALDELTARCGRSALGLVTAVGAAVRDGLPLTPVLDRMTDDANADPPTPGRGGRPPAAGAALVPARRLHAAVVRAARHRAGRARRHLDAAWHRPVTRRAPHDAHPKVLHP